MRMFTFVLSENVFHQGMVVLLNPVCVLLSGMFYVLTFTQVNLMDIRHTLTVNMESSTKTLPSIDHS